MFGACLPRGIMPLSNAAIHYVPAGYETSGPKLMGRMAAGEGFLEAYLRHAGVERFYCYARAQGGGAVRGQGAGRGTTLVEWIPWANPPASSNRARSICLTPACTTTPGAGAGAISAPTA